MIENETIEDAGLNRRIRSALEAEGAFVFRQPAQEGARWLWSVAAPMLVAASVALALCLRVTLSAPSDPVRDAIQLLSEADGVDSAEGSAVSSAELLLAWQDAPCQVAYAPTGRLSAAGE